MLVRRQYVRSRVSSKHAAHDQPSGTVGVVRGILEEAVQGVVLGFFLGHSSGPAFWRRLNRSIGGESYGFPRLALRIPQSSRSIELRNQKIEL